MRDEVRALYTDVERFAEWCEKVVRIRPIEGGRVIPFKLNPIQLWFVRRFVIPNYKQGYPIRVIILKARQMGFSTLIEAFALWCTLGHDEWNTILVATDDDQARLIFEMTQRMYDEMPVNELRLPRFHISSFTANNIWFKKPSERVKKFKSNRNEWWIDLNSKIRIASAEKKGALGKAGTWQTVHGSEVADWPQLRKSLAALLAACHDVPETSVFLESTAFGMNEFYDMWNHRTIGKLKVPYDWQNVFVPWYWDAKYEMDVEGDQQFVDQAEEALYRRIMDDKQLWRELDPDLTEDRVWHKLFWRRFTLSHKYQGDVDEFCQYYPSYAEEAFRFSGQSVYKTTELSRIETMVREPTWRGNLNIVSERFKKSADFDRYGVQLEISMTPFDYGRFKIWEYPQESMRYIIGADIAEGRASEGVSEDQSKYDFSCGQVFKVCTTDEIRRTGYLLRQVACWHGNCDPHLFGYLMVAVAQLYNWAFLAWEANGVGSALKGPILDHCGYRNIYMREDTDRIARRPASIPGWKTTGRTKPYMVSVGQMLIHNREMEIVDASTLNEMKSFSQIGENKFAAARGHDDREMAKLVAGVVAEPRLAKLRREAEVAQQEATRQFVPEPDDEWQPGMDAIFGDED